MKTKPTPKPIPQFMDIHALDINVDGEPMQIVFQSLPVFFGKHFQSVTTCVIRTTKPMRYYYGNCICHPADPLDNGIAQRYALKRAVRELWQDRVITFANLPDGTVDMIFTQFNYLYSAVRRALWEIANPKQVKEQENVTQDSTDPAIAPV